MPHRRQPVEVEFEALSRLGARCDALIERTGHTIAFTQERVRRAAASVARERERGMGCERITLRPNPIPPTLVDAEVFDDAESMEQLNALAPPCSCCGSPKKALVALVRFASLDVEMALCAECYLNLADLALGQVV